MSLPPEFQSLVGIQFCAPEQIEFYRNKKSEPFAHIYRGMGTYWVICRSLTDHAKFLFAILGGPNGYHRDENRENHLKDETEPEQSAKECANELEKEISSFYQQ